MRAAQPAARPRPADADRADGRRAASASCCRRCCAPCARRSIPVVWACDPMHGNMLRHGDRAQDAPLRRRSWPRSKASSRPAARSAVWPGGVHLEFTGEDVTECLGGSEAARGAARPPLRDALRPAPERAAVARPRVPRRRADAEARPSWLRSLSRRRRHRPDRRLRRARRAARGRRGVAGWDPDPAPLAAAAERGAVEPRRVARGRRSRAPSSRSSPRRSPRSRRRCAPCSAARRRVHRHRRRLDEGRRRRGRGGDAASSAGIRSAAPRRAGRSTRPPAVRGRDVVPDAGRGDRPGALRLVHGFVAELGAVPVAIDPAAHDRLVAMTSHLPHVLANVVVNQAGAARIEGHEPLARRRLAARHDPRSPAPTRGSGSTSCSTTRRAPRGARRAPPPDRAGRGRARGRRRRLPRALDRRGGRQPPPDARRRVRRPGRAPRLRVHSPTAPACSRGSRRRSAPSGSTSRTSSCTTSRPERGGTLDAARRRRGRGERARRRLEAQGYGVVVSAVLDSREGRAARHVPRSVISESRATSTISRPRAAARGTLGRRNASRLQSLGDTEATLARRRARRGGRRARRRSSFTVIGVRAARAPVRRRSTVATPER